MLEKNKFSVELSEKDGIYSVNADEFKKNMPDNVTVDALTAVDNYRADFVVNTGRAALAKGSDVTVAAFQMGGNTEGSLDIANNKILATIHHRASDRLSKLAQNLLGEEETVK